MVTIQCVLKHDWNLPLFFFLIMCTCIAFRNDSISHVLVHALQRRYIGRPCQVRIRIDSESEILPIWHVSV